MAFPVMVAEDRALLREALRAAFQEHATRMFESAMIIYSTDQAGANKRFDEGFGLAWKFYEEQRRAIS